MSFASLTKQAYIKKVLLTNQSHAARSCLQDVAYLKLKVKSTLCISNE